MTAILFAAVTMLAASAPAPASTAAGVRDSAMVFARPLKLEDCIGIALNKNLQLRITQAELSRARGAHVAALGKFMPTVSATATHRRVEDHVTTTDSTGAAVESNASTTTRDVSGGVVQEVPTGGTIDVQQVLGIDQARARVNNRALQATFTQPLLRGAGPTASMATLRGADYDQRAREAELTDLERQTVFNVKVAYYNVVRDVALLRVNRSTLDADSLLVEASNAMVEAKVASRRDVLSARIRLSDDASSVVIAERDAALSLDLLKDVMGIPLETAIAISDTSLQAKIVPLDEAKLIQQVLDTHPSIKSAEYGVSHSRLDLRVARNSRLPQVDLQATYLATLDEPPGVINRTHGDGWIAAVNLRYPLFDRDAAGTTILKQAELDQAQDRLKLLQRQLTLRVRDIVRTVRSSAEEVRAIQQTIAASDDKLEFATAMFNLGRASNLDITDARSDLVKARTQLVKKLVDYNAQLALLESLTGEPVVR